MRCGLLGEKLGHSYSPQIHNRLGNYTYGLFEKSLQELPRFLSEGDFHGLNVTIPYKKTVITFCSDLSERARQLGAVNTLVRKNDGSLIGHNTDYFGFSSMLKRTGLCVAGKKVLILGSGGASATAMAVLREAGANVIVISRSGENNYNNLHLHTDASVIVNATPVGMYPKTGISPIDITPFTKLEGVLDLIYNPGRTRLLMDAEKQGLITENGLWMLVSQAKESAEWFTGNKIDDNVIASIYESLRTHMQNIVLIGMPGSGKTTVGRLLADALNRPFADADIRLSQKNGRSVPEIFAQYGEPVFRELETDILAELGRDSGLVISTGGGCVTRPENYPLLHQNGAIVWLQREISDLPTEGRPLSQSSNLKTMYEIRRPMYESFCDFTVLNKGTPEETVHSILACLNMEVYA